MRTHTRLLAVAVTLSLAFVQAAAAASWGVKGGGTLAGQRFEWAGGSVWEFDGRVGVHIGVVVEWNLTPQLDVVAEAIYVQKGMTEEITMLHPDDPVPFESITLDNRLDYLSLPVLVKFRLFRGPVHPYVAVGPRVDVLLARGGEPPYEELYDDFSSLDLGLDLVAGLRIHGVLLEARYSTTHTESLAHEEVAATNSAVLISLGVLFGAGEPPN